MNRRRILLLSGFYYPDSVGGTEKYVHLLGTDLEAQGFEVVIAAPSEDEQEHDYQYAGLRVHRYPVALDPERAEVRGDVPPRYMDRFATWLGELAPDLVHMHSLTRGCGYWHAREVKARGIPLIMTVHVPSVTCAQGSMLRWGTTDCDGVMRERRCTACFLQARGLPRSAAWPVAMLPRPIAAAAAERPEVGLARLGLRSVIADRHARTRDLFALADRVVAVADWLSEVLRRNGCDPAKLLVSRHGLADEDVRCSRKARPARPSNGRLELGYVGRLDRVKGIDRVIAAFGRVDPALPIRLTIFGTARGDEQLAYAASLRRMAGADERIVFGGELTPMNRAEVLAGLDALVVPSLWFETGPLVVLEAFGAGIPVIGTRRGGIAELVADGVSGILVDGGTPEAWAAVLESAYRRYASGEWHWSMPPVRSSQQVGYEMRLVYESVLGQQKRAA